MNNLRGLQFAPDMLGHHDTMFPRPTVRVCHRVILANPHVNVPIGTEQPLSTLCVRLQQNGV